MSGNKHAIVIGANGLVGTEITKQLLKDEYYEKVTLISRRYIELEHEKLEVQIVDFKNLHKDWDLFKCDDIFYCLGTTRSDTPKKSDYHKIEFDYCVNIAKISHHNKVNKFIYISSAGASIKSWFYYLKLKGEVENSLMQIGFNYLHIVRPYVLMGKRDNFRYGESIARFFLQLFNFMMVGFLKNIKGMPANILAKAMIHYVKLNQKGTFIHTNRQIHELFPKK
jgi:uncharacterized protein YbjT (DUF2867 family)